jgi:hypothetical protein
MNQELTQYFPGTNFVTPNKIEFGIKGKFIYELSRGRKPFFDKSKGINVYGVTVKEITEDKKVLGRQDLSKYFGTEIQEAREHIENLINL